MQVKTSGDVGINDSFDERSNLGLLPISFF